MEVFNTVKSRGSPWSMAFPEKLLPNSLLQLPQFLRSRLQKVGLCNLPLASFERMTSGFSSEFLVQSDRSPTISSKRIQI